MERWFLDKVEDNEAELKEIWGQWSDEVDLVPMIEEYMALLQCSKFQVDRVYLRAVNVPTFSKKLISVIGMSEQWVVARIKKKGDSKCVPWRSLKDSILTHPDVRKRLDVFGLSIYGLVVFPKALGYVDEAVTDLFDRLDKKVTTIPRILAGTFRSLSACWKTGEEEDVEWRAPWLLPDEMLYKCGSFDWVPLLGIWGAAGYAPLLVLRNKIQEMSSAWKETPRMKRLAVGPMTTPKYHEWWARRINDNTPKLNQEDSQSIEEHLRVIPSELEIIRQDFERRNADLEKRIEQMEPGKVAVNQQGSSKQRSDTR
ncbi:hypothetical protein GOBAR_DD34978 [Gossypium barbadense]|nr:hypothetical protein GOBAR_DD34978 [Gossypium barbadense]